MLHNNMHHILEFVAITIDLLPNEHELQRMRLE